MVWNFRNLILVFLLLSMAEPSFNLCGGDLEGNEDSGIEVPSSPMDVEERQEILDELGDGLDAEDEEAPKDDWIPLDEDLLADALAGGRERSKSANKWARGRFDEWRKAFNFDVGVPVEKLPLRRLNELLTRFMLQAKKKNGKLYPPASLSCLFRGIGRIVRRERERVKAETGIREYPFDIQEDPIFCQSREAFICVIRKTRQEGNYDRPRNKAPAITFSEERDILADIDHQITHSTGCIKRLAYYILTRFGIRGAKELKAVLDVDITLGFDNGGEIIKYGERISKNHQPTITKFDERHFRKPIWTHELDFIVTYKQYVRHLPAKEQDSKPRALFLQPIMKPRENVWYAVTPVGVNNLSKWLKVMGSVIGPETQICNKSGRVSLVSRLSAANVPAEVGMTITGHKNRESYEKYDRTLDLKIDACMDLVSNPINQDGSTRSFANVLSDEICKSTLTNACRAPLVDLSNNIPAKESTSRLLRSTDFVAQQENIPDSREVNAKQVAGQVACQVAGQIGGQVAGQIGDQIAGQVGQVPGEAAGQVVRHNDGKGQIAIAGDSALTCNSAGTVYCDLVDDEYDDEFYKELSIACPDSARALGKYHAPVMNNSGNFTGCTFNFGIDANQLFNVMSAVMKKH